MHLWKDTSRKVQVLLGLLCPMEGANQTIKRMPFGFTDIDSLNDWWVLKNIPMKPFTGKVLPTD